MQVLRDATYSEIIAFLDAVEQNGMNIKTSVNPIQNNELEASTVTSEAKLLKKMFLQLIE